ncbi:uncharacterized protein LOC124169671 [Ischnura elegans]|uniref:uncharacterized protein LOC124169671 n=1 Tax=Ischnura elegans TaxID=197161 RepID=UPI001ED86942|nr:uncharacterized protein LOC124169671 [Ischnura elegans]
MCRRLDLFHATVLGLCLFIAVVASEAQALDDEDVVPLPTDYYTYYEPSANREEDLERLYDFLAGLLRNEAGGGGGDSGRGLVYEEGGDEEWEGSPPDGSSVAEPEGRWVGKRNARYSGRYTWKRRSGNTIAGGRTTTSDSRGRYMCNPTREDIFQLLVALHEAREGNSRRIVNFCNRKRPASAIYTNIRFLGKRRK